MRSYKSPRALQLNGVWEIIIYLIWRLGWRYTVTLKDIDLFIYILNMAVWSLG